MHRALSLFVVASVLAVAMAAGAGTLGASPDASTTPAMTVIMDEGNTVRLRSGEKTTTVLLTISGVPEGDLRKAPPVITDITKQASEAKAGSSEASVQFTPRQLLQNTSTVIWLVDVELLKGNAQGARLATIELGGQRLARPYVLTNEPAAAVAATWTATASSPWIMGSSRDPLPIIVTANETPLTDVQVLDSTLRNAFERIGPDRLQIVTHEDVKDRGEAETGGKDKIVPARSSTDKDVKDRGEAETGGKDKIVLARSSTVMYVKLKNDDPFWTIPHGKFEGVITLKANSLLQQPLTVSMQSSSWWMKLLGLFAVGVGLWIAKYITGKLIPSTQRVQALRPVLAVRAAITDLENEAVRLFGPVPNSEIRDRLEGLQKSISTRQLDDRDLLPRGFISPLPLTAKAVGTLEATLTEVTTALKAVSAVIYKGLRVAATDRGNPVYDQANVNLALKQLDQLGGDSTKDETAVLQEIPSILMAYRVRPRAGVAAHTQNLRGPMDPVSVREAEYRIYESGQEAWLIWMVISAIASIPVIFIPNFASFSLQDVFTCLVWGVGLPIGGAALQTLTPASVASGIGLTLPKGQ